MAALDSEVPYFYWTLDEFDDLKVERNQQGFGGSIWKRNTITSDAIGASYLTFGPPEEWAEDISPIRIQRAADGRYEYHAEGITY
jgi:hypothetical protein